MRKGRLRWFGVLCVAGIFSVSAMIITGCVNNASRQGAQSQAPAENAAADTNPDQKPELLSTDCRKCHEAEPEAIQRAGGKHKTEVTCRDCHEEHLPLGTNTIPKCSKCHDSSDREHFGLPNCLACHSNPHTPLNLTIPDVPASSTGCKTCHPEKGKEFEAYPSKHAQKNCTFCHPDKHKVINKCLQCHQPHADFMVYEDCLRCHKPHSPLNITYADDTPSKYCGACHTDIYQSLTTNPSKHQKLNCAFCHKHKHPTVPKCTDCHKNIHDNSVLSQFTDCLKCHVNPHDLVI